MEKETLEEASENYEKIHGGSYSIGVGKAFKFGAEWLAGRMYSEEEVQTLLYKRDLYLLNRDEEVELELPDEWFEQFKKK